MTPSFEIDSGITRDIYGMPAFVTLAVPDVRATAAWWVRALGFLELFAMPPGEDPSLVHLRRWRHQDVLVRRGSGGVGEGIQLSVAADPAELDEIAGRARDVGADVVGPDDTAWNTRDVRVLTPEGLTVVFTAPRARGDRDETFSDDMRRWTREQGG